ncbi:MAG: hypothetical protein WD067_00360 [Gaiellaceae bacterium]
MATVLCVLYDDPVDGYPPAYARDEIPAIERYAGGQTTPTPERLDFTQPAPRDHRWRTMPHHGMTPHTSGTSLSAQARYAAGVREILECWSTAG